MNISDIKARQILDSRGNPTVEADVWVDGEFAGRAAVPSGASTGEHEAHEMRDGGDSFGGKSVLQAVDNIEKKILPAVSGMHVYDQLAIDQAMIELDGTKNKSGLGANAILAVSLAAAHAAASARDILLYAHINDIFDKRPMSIPMPMMNVLNGGKHATNSSDFQEFMIMPKRAGAYAEAIRMGAEIFQQLKSNLQSKNVSTAVGDEGGFTYPVQSNVEMLDLLMEAISGAGYSPGEDIGIALDIAAAEFYENNSYTLAAEGKQLSSQEMIAYISDMSAKYPIVSVEDGLDEDDWVNWQELTKTVGNNIQLVGDDLLVTNPIRLQKAIELNAANAILIKPNQIGTLSETLQAIRLAQENGWGTIISHRSGETEDTTIAHIAVGTGAGQIKTGSLSRGERTAKHNELMRIESIDDGLQITPVSTD